MELAPFLQHLLLHPPLHILWLNTLSYLENCGARKIAAFQHPTLVKKEILKHAAEEFRHALHLKMQILKITSHPPPDYSLSFLLGGYKTLHYLDRLEVLICRKYRQEAYTLVTYAIEKRAEKLYGEYFQFVQQNKIPISLKSIMLEEKEHLAEMEERIAQIEPAYPSVKEEILSYEESIYRAWVQELKKPHKGSPIKKAKAFAPGFLHPKEALET